MKTLAIFVASLFLFPSPRISAQEQQDVPVQVEPASEPVVSTPVIHLSGVVDDGMESMVAQQLKEINETGKATSALVLINSPGGSVISMLQIIDDFRQSNVPLMCLDTGLAASAAAVILLSKGCKFNGMLASSVMMIHQAKTSADGRETEFNSAVAAFVLSIKF